VTAYTTIRKMADVFAAVAIKVANPDFNGSDLDLDL
jgi:hypothetical protein